MSEDDGRQSHEDVEVGDEDGLGKKWREVWQTREIRWDTKWQTGEDEMWVNEYEGEMDVRRRVDKDKSVGWRGWRDWMRRQPKEKHKMERGWRNGQNQWLRHGREDEERKRKDWKSDRREVCSKCNDAVKATGQVPRRFPSFRLIPVEVSLNATVWKSRTHQCTFKQFVYVYFLFDGYMLVHKSFPSFSAEVPLTPLGWTASQTWSANVCRQPSSPSSRSDIRWKD